MSGAGGERPTSRTSTSSTVTPRAEFERVPVPEHTTHRMTVHNPLYPMDPPWVFTYAKTGCLRVQRGDFCAYVPAEVLGQLGQFLAMRPDA